MGTDYGDGFCKYCKRVTEIIEDRSGGAYICSECGYHLEQFLDTRSEWRTFSNDTEQKDRSRGGQLNDNLLSGMANMATVIVASNDKSREMIRGHTKTSKLAENDKLFMKAVREINVLGERMNLTSRISEKAKTYYKASEKNTKGCTTTALCAAALLMACRHDNIPFTMKAVGKIAGVGAKDLGKAMKTLKSVVRTKAPLNVGDYATRFCTELDLPQNVKLYAEKITSLAISEGLCGGRSPTSVVAAAIYLASQLSDTPKTQKEIGDIVDVSETTVRLAYKALFEHRKQFDWPDFLEGRNIEELPIQ